LNSPLDHEFRSRDLADSLRNYLIGINTGGIAVVTAISKNVAWVPAIACFVLGIVFCGASLFYAQHRELKRRDATSLKKPVPSFAWYQTSVWWNAFSFLSFVTGAMLSLLCYQA
jgi:hypothetical protein